MAILSVAFLSYNDYDFQFKCCGIPGPIPNEKPYRIWLQNAHFNDRNMQARIAHVVNYHI